MSNLNRFSMEGMYDYDTTVVSIGFFDDGYVMLRDSDVEFDFKTPINWKVVKHWCECKDLIVDFEPKNRRYAEMFLRRLLTQTYRPATLQVRDMVNLSFSIACFFDSERIALDQLQIFKLENSRVSTR